MTLSRQRWNLGGLRVRLVAGACALVLIVSIAGAALFARVARRELTHEFDSTTRSLAQNLSRNAAHGVFIESRDVLQELHPELRRRL